MNKILFSLVMLVSLNLFADSGALTFEGTISNSYSEAFATSTPNTFLVKTSSSETHGSFIGSGDFSQVNQNLDQTDVEVAGETYQGYSKLMIAPKDLSKNQVTLSEDTDITKESIHMKLSYTADAVIVSGTWQDYLDGDEITVRMTDEGNAIVAKAMGDSMSAASLNSLQQQMPDAEFSVKTKVSNVSNTGICKMSKIKAICTSPNLKLFFQIQARF